MIVGLLGGFFIHIMVRCEGYQVCGLPVQISRRAGTETKEQHHHRRICCIRHCGAAGCAGCACGVAPAPAAADQHKCPTECFAQAERCMFQQPPGDSVDKGGQPLLLGKGGFGEVSFLDWQP